MRLRGLARAAVVALVGLAVAAPAAAPAARAATAPGAVMILLDNDAHLGSRGVAAERRAALAYLAGLRGDVQTGLITFANHWRLAAPLGAGRASVDSALAGIRPGGGTAHGIYGALAASGAALRRVAGPSRLLVLSDGEELTGRPALTSSVPVDVVGFSFDQDDHLPPLARLAAASGGRAVTPGQAATLSAVFSPASSPAAHTAPAPGGLPLVILLAVVFAAILAALLVMLGSLRQIDRRRQLAQRLERYAARAPASSGQAGEGKVANTVLGWGSRLLQTSNAEPRLASRLDLAGISRRPAEWVVFGVCAAALLAAVTTVLSGNAVVGIVVGALSGSIGMRLLLSWRIARRRRAFSDQLPDVLQLIAGALQAGFSLPQALDGMVREAAEPAGAEFSRALAETRIGVDLSDALGEVADRMESEDLRWTVMAIRIQRQVGGNLAEVLRNTVDTMRERAFLRRHVRALSAEGRLSAYILIALPILIAIWLFISSPTYMAPLYTTVFGLLLLAGGALLMVLGTIWLRNLVKMEV